MRTIVWFPSSSLLLYHSPSFSIIYPNVFIQRLQLHSRPLNGRRTIQWISMRTIVWVPGHRKTKHTVPLNRLGEDQRLFRQRRQHWLSRTPTHINTKAKVDVHREQRECVVEAATNRKPTNVPIIPVKKETWRTKSQTLKNCFNAPFNEQKFGHISTQPKMRVFSLVERYVLISWLFHRLASKCKPRLSPSNF